jgi:urate oxidase
MLSRHTYRKGRTRVVRDRREGERREVRELTAEATLESALGRFCTVPDASSVAPTDTIKNVVHVVARESLQAPAETLAPAMTVDAARPTILAMARSSRAEAGCP